MFRFLVISIFVLFSVNVFGQAVKLNYSEQIGTDTPTKLSIALDQKFYLRIVANSDFSSKKEIVLTHYKCHNGVITKTDLSDFPVNLSVGLSNKDSLVVEVMMQQVNDSVSLAFAFDGKVRDLAIPRNYVIPSKDGEKPRYILMETILDSAVTIEDEIPIFAVTSGIIKSLQFGETKIYGQDLCGLRDKHIHPDVWHTVEGVQDYTFYTIMFK